MYIRNPSMIGRRLRTQVRLPHEPRMAWDWTQSPLRLLLDQCRRGIPTVLKVKD